MKDSRGLEFHISRRARDRYQFDQGLFSLSGNVIFADFHAVRVFVQKVNRTRDLERFPERALLAGQMNAMGLIDEILHLVVGYYRQQVNADALRQALNWLNDRLGKARVDIVLRQFVQEFPPVAVYRREVDEQGYLESETEGVPNRQIVLEEMLMLWIANMNPAFAPFMEFFDDANLEKDTAYLQVMVGLHDFFETQPFFGPDHQNLIDMLRSPAIAVPHSLSGQLEFIRQRWAQLLGKHLFRLLSSLDLIREEEKIAFLGPGPARVYDFTSLEFEAERFSPDRDWMPSLVLIAKNAYVWLDQLSKRYQQHIYHLDQIPDEELDTLARWGFTGLWLIGLWERSSASQRIKQLRGNPDAVASAYSLLDYQIANDLGGEEAYAILRARAWQRGIRLASDMVPNHMGIDSRWVIEHPDWFVGLDYSPFPSYSFSGPNLSWDDRVGLYLEDHYYDGTDAAVVFKRVDQWTGDAKYIYHGNDGTSMPWNDTAQLDYLNPQVREAVIQTILHVARKFPVIRFDAAMTLAKKHYQRLWFPEPGTGGAIPSRSEHGLTKEQFDQAFPEEFWRMVVDRVAQEVPDTLLLAEAFWLMEGYFVRTLGMHRVYNSAFMNMLRDEKNQEYRLVIKNTLEFDPEILKRYVNFMNNPDERTAVDQFGKGDKYFGISTMLATMPGLPMFGHGQVEGFSEKYGMEFRRAYWSEEPDGYLVSRHEREIFPLLRRRYLFAEVKDFLLYDFYTPEGFVNEDVFAYSNQVSGPQGGQPTCSLVIYHNKYAETRGWVRTSAAYSTRTDEGSERILVQRNLGEGLGLHDDEDYFVIFREHISGLEYIRNSREIYAQGLYAELRAYQCSVFLDFRELQDNEWHQFAQLSEYLNGRGVPDMDEALKEIFLQPLHYPFRELVNAGLFRWLMENRVEGGMEPWQAESLYTGTQSGLPTLPSADLEPVLSEVEQKSARLLREVNTLTQAGAGEAELQRIAAQVSRRIDVMLEYPLYTGAFRPDLSVIGPVLLDLYPQSGTVEAETWGTLFGWAFTASLGAVMGPGGAAERSRSWIDEWLLGKITVGALQDFGLNENAAWEAINLVRLLVKYQSWAGDLNGTPGGVADSEQKQAEEPVAYRILRTWLRDSEVQRYIMVNRYKDVLWFNKEAFERLLGWFLTMADIDALADTDLPVPDRQARLADQRRVVQSLLVAEGKSGYQVEKLLEAAK
jgi:glycosidase